MTDWPKMDELKQVLDSDPDSQAWDGDADGTRLTRLLAAAIDITKSATGAWDEAIDVPDANLAQAALRAAQLLAPPINRAPETIDSDPIFNRLMLGRRRRFAVS
jgi:hypothetical protein